jgi:hypothetical protein
MSDVFNNQTKYGGSFRANELAMTFSLGQGADIGVGLMIQQLQGQYQQSVTRIWEISADNRSYYVIGRAEGQASVGRIRGPFELKDAFLDTYGNACKVATNVINIGGVKSGCDAQGNTRTNSNIHYRLEHVILTGMGFGVGAENMVMNESQNLYFAALSRNKR